jgi:hypothetical protein
VRSLQYVRLQKKSLQKASTANMYIVADAADATVTEEIAVDAKADIAARSTARTAVAAATKK